jgi:hypothetical protein
MVECKLCGQYYGRITASHLKAWHGIEDVWVYLAMFPDAILEDEEYKGNLSAGLRLGHLLNPDWSKAISKAQPGICKIGTWTEEQREDQSRLMRSVHRNDPTIAERTGKAFSGQCKFLDEDYCEMMREAALEAYRRDPTIVERISESLTGIVRSEETLRRMSEAQTGRMHNEESKKQMSESHKQSYKNDPTLAGRIGRSVAESFKYRPKQDSFWGIKPTSIEFYLGCFLDDFQPYEWKYTGDGKFWVGRKNPDFTNANGRKQVIEVLGCYWHDFGDDKELVSYYRTLGWDCLVFWDYELDPYIVLGKLTQFTDFYCEEAI